MALTMVLIIAFEESMKLTVAAMVSNVAKERRGARSKNSKF
jgi:hypothetical protein